MSTLGDIQALRDLGWSWTRIAAHYRVSEREVRRWLLTGTAPEDLSAPLTLRWGTALIVSDTQFPYIDHAAWEVTCQIAVDASVDLVIWDGDMLDFESLSSYKHNPYAIRTAGTDVDEFHGSVREPLVRAVRPRERWVNGNHEWRYTKYLIHNAPAVHDRMPSPRDFLQLPLGVEFVEWGKASGTWLTPKLLVAHGWQARKHSAYTAKANAEDVGGSVSVITGHTHRVGWFAHNTRGGGVQGSWEVGHMCDPTNLPKAIEGYQNWQQVVATIVRYERNGDAFHVEVVPVIGSKGTRAVCNATDREYVIER